MRRAFVTLCVLGLAGCASHDRPLEQRGPAVAQVVEKLPSLELPEVRMPPPSRADVMAAYRRVYGSVPDTRENQAVGRRLADLEMQAGEDKDAAGEGRRIRRRSTCTRACSSSPAPRISTR